MPYIRKVYQRLQELQNTLVEFRGLVIRERADIIGLKLSDLKMRSQEVESFFSGLQALNKQTATDIADACKQHGIDGTGLTRLLSVIPKPDREQFAVLQKAVLALGADVENNLAINRALLKDSIEFASSSLQLLTTSLKRTGTSVYGQQGRYVETIDQPRIICKEI